MFFHRPKKPRTRPDYSIIRYKPRAYDPKVDLMLARWAAQRQGTRS